MVEIINRSRLAGQALRTVRNVLTTCVSVDQIHRLAGTETSRTAFWSAVAYRDNSHDLILSRPSDAYVFVFDTACGGAVRGVTIWDRKPSSHDLRRVRAERRRSGSTLGSPEKVSVHASCRFGCNERRPVPAPVGL